MDEKRFDRLTRALSEAGTRRGLLGVLATLPVLGGLVAFLPFMEDAEAKGRRRRRKKRHKHGKGREKGKHKKPTCKPHAKSKTCSGKCGTITNNCKKSIDCGSCDCDPVCEECFTCQGEPGTPGQCVLHSTGTPCGDAATCEHGMATAQGSCDGSGHCEAVTPVSCAPYTCDGNACATSCRSNDDCAADSFCNGDGQCVGDKPNGEQCQNDGQCQSGHCASGVCCQTVCDGECETCAVSGDGRCTPVADGSDCGGENICCNGSCQECCDSDSCPGNRPFCLQGTCEPCQNDAESCPNDDCCNAESGECVATCPTSASICGADNICAPCTSHAECGDDALCVNGLCQACDLVDGQNLVAAVAAAQPDSTLYLCPGTYTGPGSIHFKNLNLQGAGEGLDGTILVGPEGDQTVYVYKCTVGLDDLRITGGDRGGVFVPDGTATLTNCTITENSAAAGGGGLYTPGGHVTLTNCTVSKNGAGIGGGGIYNPGGTVILNDTIVTDNEAGEQGGGIWSIIGGNVTFNGSSVVCGNDPDQCAGDGFTNPNCPDVCPP